MVHSSQSEKNLSFVVELTLDTRGLACPLPLLKAKQGMRALALGQVLEVLSSDRGSWTDFPAWMQVSGHQLLLAEEVDNYYRYCIEKKV